MSLVTLRRRRPVRAHPWASDARAWPLLRAPGRPRMGGRRGSRDRPLLRLALFVAAAVLAGFTLLWGTPAPGEGEMLQAAQRIADGELPYRDFWLAHAPGQPLLLAGLVKLLGPSLLWWRILRLALVATIPVLAFALARRRTSPAWALLAWAGAAGAMAWPSEPGPIAPALALALGAVLLAGRSPIAGGALAGLAAAFQPELGAGAALGAMVAAGGDRARPAPLAPLIGRDGLRALAAAVAVAVLAWAPFVIAAPRAVLDEAVGFRGEQHVPFPLDYRGDADPAELLRFYLPLILLAGLAIWVLAALVRRPAREGIALVPLALAGLAYLLARTDPLHLVPLAVTLAVMLAIAAAREPPAPVRFLLAAALGLIVVHGWERRVEQALDPPAQARLTASVADGVRAGAADAAALNRLVPYVDARVPASEPMYASTRCSTSCSSGATPLASTC